MEKTTDVVPEEQHFILSSLPPGRAQKRLAIAVVIALLVAFFVTAGPLSTVRLGRVDAFVPVYGTAVFVVDLITAVLLFAQFSILRSRALLAIAIGYLLTAFAIVPWMLTFPGIFSPSGLLDASLQSAAWLYVLWHAGFPTFVIAYALLKDADPAKHSWRGSAGAAIVSSIATSAAVVCAATLFVTAEEALLPPLLLDALRLAPLWFYVAAFAVLLNVVALVVLWVRRRSLLDLWLMVVMFASVIEVCFVSFPVPARFSIGWYAGRVCAVLSDSLVLFVLLYEITKLYAQLLRAVFAQRREREARLLTGDAVTATIAHEVKQPLSGMVTNADAGLRWLDRPTPDLNEAKAAFKQIVADGRRAAAVIERVRAMYRKEDPNKAAFDINGLVGETLALARGELLKHRIVVQADLTEQLPQVIADRIQLRQVLVNLIANAIDSMAATEEPRILCVKSEVHSDGVKVSVRDTGTGISSHDMNRIFDPLFTTKSGGMGMGLSICRSIIEAHSGRIWVGANEPRGAIIEFVLLADDGAPSAGTSQEEQRDDLPHSFRL
jgi:signal transduction histidine kinase